MPPNLTLKITFFSSKKAKRTIFEPSSRSTSSLETSFKQLHLNPKANRFNHLHPLILTNVNGNISFQDLMPHIQTYHSYWIPSLWPKPLDQRGHCCGLYALETALQYANPGVSVPPARKNGNPSLRSLRQIAKEKGYSAFGEIFNVAHLQKVAEISGYFDCKALKLKSLSFVTYRNKICILLREGFSVIVSCDLGGAHDTPSQAKGLEAHWALVFGYFYFNNHCYFLVTQYGRYYIWSAVTLYESNVGLPDHNPRSGPTHVYHKNKESGEEFFIQVAQPLSPDILKTARYCLTKTLTDFQFTGLATPTLALSKSLNLNARSLAAQILPLDQPSATEEGLRIT